MTATVLALNTPLAVAGAEGSEQHFVLPATDSFRMIAIALTGGSGDADLYYRLGADIDETAMEYDGGSWMDGTLENIEVPVPAGQALYLMVEGFTAFSGATLLTAIAPSRWTEYRLPQRGDPSLYEDIVWYKSVQAGPRLYLLGYGAGDPAQAYLTSTTDLSAWTTLILPADGSGIAYFWVDMAWNGSRLCIIACETDGFTPTVSVCVTDDGRTLRTPQPLPLTSGVWTLWNSIAANDDGVFVAVGQANIVYAADGEGWVEATLPVTLNAVKGFVGWDGAYFVHAGEDSSSQQVVLRSQAGAIWEQVVSPTLPAGTDLRYFKSGAGFILAGIVTPAITTDHGQTWVKPSWFSVDANSVPAAYGTVDGAAASNGRDWTHVLLFAEGAPTYGSAILPRLATYSLADPTNRTPVTEPVIPALEGSIFPDYGNSFDIFAPLYFNGRLGLIRAGALFLKNLPSFWTGFINCEDAA